MPTEIPLFFCYLVNSYSPFSSFNTVCTVLNIMEIPQSSVADPDPYVFGPPGSGSGSISQIYGPGSGSFYHQAKKSEKP
jgi:hypothetical protein